MRSVKTLMLLSLIVSALCVSGCQLPGLLARRDDNLSERLNSPLSGDLHFAGTESRMNAPAPSDFQEPADSPSEGRWAGFWSKLKPSRSISLPRTDFRATEESSEEAQDDTSLNAGF